MYWRGFISILVAINRHFTHEWVCDQHEMSFNERFKLDFGNWSCLGCLVVYYEVTNVKFSCLLYKSSPLSKENYKQTDIIRDTWKRNRYVSHIQGKEKYRMIWGKKVHFIYYQLVGRYLFLLLLLLLFIWRSANKHKNIYQSRNKSWHKKICEMIT